MRWKRREHDSKESAARDKQMPNVPTWQDVHRGIHMHCRSKSGVTEFYCTFTKSIGGTKELIASSPGSQKALIDVSIAIENR
jgi:hypothetical protein